MAADVASVQFSRTVEKRVTPADLRVDRSRRAGASSREPVDAGLSKLNSMLGLFCGRERLCSPSSKGDARGAAIQPGSVDMLGPIRLDITRPQGPGDRAARLATDHGSGHRVDAP